MGKIKYKIAQWLGICKLIERLETLERLYKDLALVGVDVHFKEPHMILVFSRFNGGTIRHIEANFDSIRDLELFCQELKKKFNTEKFVFDAHSQVKDYFKNNFGR